MFSTSSRNTGRAPHPLLTGAAAGLLAGGAAGGMDRLLDRFISSEQKRRDKRVRTASAHVIAGPYFARKILGKRLGAKGKRRARIGFGLAYGVVWGLAYAAARKKVPLFTRWGGLPFGLPFFVACDGILAPLLGISPPLRRIPWQPSAKELGNHLAWTVAAELVHRAVASTRGRGHKREFEKRKGARPGNHR